MAEYPIPNLSNDLSGQVALVTGTTSGLGKKDLLRLLLQAERRWRSLVVGLKDWRRSPKTLGAAGGTAEPIHLDMQDNESIMACVDRAEAALGTVTILVNNAGIPDAQRAHKMSLELIDSVFDTNLRGPYVLSCEIARRLIAAEKPGRMVNISSVGGFNYGGNGAALYSITKSAIVRMTECLAVEWARYNINVNAIAPGAFESEMMDGMLERLGDIAQHFPRKRICDPAQMDSTLLYFLSPASEAVTGTYIKIDDGQGSR